MCKENDRFIYGDNLYKDFNMTSIERTAYPRFHKYLRKPQELKQLYNVNNQEYQYIVQNVRDQNLQANFAVQLKVFQQLHYFPDLSIIPEEIISHIISSLPISPKDFSTGYKHNSSLYRHRSTIRKYLNITEWSKASQKFAIQVSYEAAQTMNNPADIINTVVEKLVANNYELPIYNTLERLVKHTRSIINRQLYLQCYQQLSNPEQKILHDLLIAEGNSSKTGYNALKKLPQKPTITHFKELLQHHDWLMSLCNISDKLSDISKIKIKQFAAQANSLDASDLKKYTNPRKYALLSCMLYQAQHIAKDALAITFCKTISKMHKRASDKLELVRKQKTPKTLDLLNILSNILEKCCDNPHEELLPFILDEISNNGGAEVLQEECIQAIACNSNNHYIFLWEFFSKKRAVMFKLLQSLKLQSAFKDDALIKAMQVIIQHKERVSEYIETNLDLSFASKQWQLLIVTGEEDRLHKRYLEMCVFSSLAEELNAGDIFIENAGDFANYREELLEQDVADPLIADYCKQFGLPENGKGFVAMLKKELADIASSVDKQYPELSELVISEDGKPVLKKYSAKTYTPNSYWLSSEIRQRIPERNILDILCNTHHYAGWAHEFGPISGTETKIDNAIERYVITNFAYGSCMGPTQAARHINSKDISAHMLSWINRRHVTPKMLDKALTKLINFGNAFPVIQAWGDGKSCAADGTLRRIREDNLISAFHVRYTNTGGIAYHHIANNYIALFSTFIPCGVWEAVEILEGLIKNQSDIQPETVHSDTQGQSAVVFALAYLLQIKLMPRIRNWKGLNLYRPHKQAKYKHIDSLFSDKPVNWKLIENTWEDMMRVVVSIKQGKITTSLLLRKLTNYSKRDPLYQGFHELGKVIRTQFLLNYISDVDLREIITAETNKVESYNNLSEWASFGAIELVASNDENEMEKAIKYNSIITNSVILQNIIDMNDIIYQLIQDGKVITKNDIACLSPYLVEHIKRFGEYVIDIKNIPKNIDKTRMTALW